MSPRPGRVLDDVPVPFGYPRSPDLRFTAEFSEIAGRVSRTLREAHPAPPAGGGRP
jgi:NitT/TauT family transport system ATP-binding protein